MKMELIQPFINAADAVLAQGLQSPMSIGNLTMEEEAYRRKGVAALVRLSGCRRKRMRLVSYSRSRTKESRPPIRRPSLSWILQIDVPGTANSGWLSRERISFCWAPHLAFKIGNLADCKW